MPDSSPVAGRVPPDDVADDATDDATDEPDTGGTTSPVGGRAPPPDQQQPESDTTDEADTGGTTSPVAGQTPPPEQQQPDSSTTDEPDTGGTTSPVAGQTPPPEQQQPGGSTTEEYDTGGTTSPVAGQTPPQDQQQPGGETETETSVDSSQAQAIAQETGLEQSELEELRSDVASQSPYIDPSDVRFEQTEEGVRAVPIESEVRQNIRQDVAGQSDLYEPSDVTVEQTDEGLQAFVPQDVQEQAFREQVAEQQDVPIEQVNVEQVSPFGGTSPSAGLDQDAIEQAQPRLVASIDQPETQEATADDAQQVLEIDSDELVDPNVVNQGSGDLGQTTDPNLQPGDLEQPSFGEAVVGGTQSFFRDPYGTTLEPGVQSLASETEQEISNVEDYASEQTGVDIDRTATVTGETLVDRPVDSFVTGVATVRTGAAAAASDAGGAAALAPATATGTGAATTVGTGTAIAGGLVLAPAATASLGVRGIQEEGVTPPPAETSGVTETEITVGEGTGTQSEIETPESTEEAVIGSTEIVVNEQTQATQQTQEIDVVSDDGTTTGEQPPEITVDETTGQQVSEVDVPIEETPTGNAETSVIVDQPTGGFEDLPRDDELAGDVTEETDEPPDSIIEERDEQEIGEQFEQADNRPLYEREYLQEEVPSRGGTRVRDELGSGTGETTTWLFADVLGSSFSQSVTEPSVSVATGSGTDSILDELTGAQTDSQVQGQAGPTVDATPDVLADVLSPVATDAQAGYGSEAATETATETVTDYANPQEYAYEYQFVNQQGGRRGRRRLPPFRLPSFEGEGSEPSGEGFEGFADVDVGEYLDPFSGEFE